LWNNEQSIKSIEGIDIAWVEEAQTITKTSLEVLTPTVRKEGSQIIYTYNRLTVSDPVHTRLVEEGRPNTLFINVNYDIAEKYGLLPKVIKEEIEDDKLRRPILYKQKWLGEPYVSPNDLLSELALTKCLSNEVNAQDGRAIIGVDTGHDIYYTLVNKQGVFYYGYCQSPQEKNEPNYDPYDEIDKHLKNNPRWILMLKYVQENTVSFGGIFLLACFRLYGTNSRGEIMLRFQVPTTFLFLQTGLNLLPRSRNCGLP
jgi:PBSX family phage terminase large subunit